MTRRSPVRHALGFAVLVAGLGLGTFAERGAGAPETGARRGVPVVVELFSSEGCSSCPPADALLRRLDRDQPVAGVTVLALEFHVDYWNYLGWKDPFSDAVYSERQQDYARVLPEHGIFTPELVVAGRSGLVGSDEVSARRAIQAARGAVPARVDVRIEGGAVSVFVTSVPALDGDAFDVWLATTESDLETDVRAGENRGHRLVHGPVVRRLARLGAVEGGTFAGRTKAVVEPGSKPANVRWVAFVQGRSSRRIVGAGAAPALGRAARPISTDSFP